MGLIKKIKMDYYANNLSPIKSVVGFLTLSTFYLVLAYRISNLLFKAKVPVIPYMVMAFCRVIYGADISPKTSIGGGFRIAHSVGIVIGDWAEIGDNFNIFQNTTIGSRGITVAGRRMPIIGDNVSIFTGAVVLGPVTVGNNVSIAANATVISDVEDNKVVGGTPAKVINEVDKAHSLISLEVSKRKRA